jgi:hypothetical protein
MLKVILDANIFVSAVLKPHSHLARIFEWVKEDKIRVVLSDGILSEIEAVLRYPKIRKRHRQNNKQIEEFLKKTVRISILTQGKIHTDTIKKDPSDNKYLSAAMEAKADFIVSGGYHLKDLKTFQGIRILDPSTFVVLMTKS